MSKRKNKKQRQHQLNATTDSTHSFAFGDPEPVLSNNLVDYLGIFPSVNDEFYLPPISYDGLAKCMGANGYHNSCIHFKKNMILLYFVASGVLSYEEMQKAALDYVVTGQFFLKVILNRLGGFLKLIRLPATAMRVGIKKDYFYRILTKGTGSSLPGVSTKEYKPGEVIHIKEPDIRQDIYGLPEYLGGLQSVLLSEDATLFRRKYYKNGAHMGYVLVTHDAGLDSDTVKNIHNKVSESKGPGNFRSLYINVPKSNTREPVKVVPVGDIATKDEFERVKRISKEEIIAMHRIQPGLAGLIPEGNGSFGDLNKIMEVYHLLEIEAMQKNFLLLNEYLPKGKKIEFRDPDFKKETE